MGNENPQSKSLPSAGEIWFIERPLMLGTDDPHYGLVTALANGLIYFYFITTNSDEEHFDFRIGEDAEDFRNSGLKHTSHIRRHEYHGVKLQNFQAKYRGKLTGELKKAVEDWYGDRLG